MRKPRTRDVYDKYYQLWPYDKICKVEHDYAIEPENDNGISVRCVDCGWPKYEIEIQAEIQMKKRISRISNAIKLEKMHISLFHF